MPFPVDPRYVQEAQQKLGTTFPPRFTEKMLRDNGGEVEAADDTWQLYPVLDRTNRKRIARTCNDIVRETVQMRQWPAFPPGAVAIAGNGTADQLILLPDPPEMPERPERPEPGAGARLQPAVFLWDHETGELEKIADDVGELF